MVVIEICGSHASRRRWASFSFFWRHFHQMHIYDRRISLRLALQHKP
jgi:hypothetical protein